MDQLLEFSDKDVKATLIKMLQLIITNSLATKNKKSQQRNWSYFFKSQMEIIELKKITETKISLDEPNSRVEMTESRINEFENRK